MTWVEPEQWYAHLASFYAAAAAFITDPDDRVLLVKPNYQDHWALPGGYVDQQENPAVAVARELHEELGLEVAAGPLLLIDWASPAGKRPRSIISFLFDGGTIQADAEVRLNSDELEGYDFYTGPQCQRLLPPSVAPRVPAALHARAAGAPTYLIDAVPHEYEPQR